MTLDDLYRKTLIRSGGSPEEVLKLIQIAFKISPERFWSRKKDIRVNFNSKIKFFLLLFRLKRGEPLSYITGKKEFFSEEFFVGRGVLIPRPETELLVEKILEIVQPGSKILDMGSGSGIIGITIAKLSDSNVTLIEKNRKALFYLKKNVHFHNIQHRVKVHRGDLFSNIEEKFDIIASNPPYISREDYEKLGKNIKKFEPKEALLGGNSGFYYIEEIIRDSFKYLNKGGMLFLEIGYNQKEKVERLMKRNGFSEITFFKDLSGIDRVVRGFYENTSH